MDRLQSSPHPMSQGQGQQRTHGQGQEQWKRKNKVDDDTKVFIICGGYGDIKHSLENRGWVQNKDYHSPCFDFKWTVKTNDISQGDLQDH